MTIADYHVHTAFSIDCDVPMEEQCRAAIAAGVNEIAFTEHVDHDECDLESREQYDYVAYVEELERCRELFGDQLQILKAAEIDWNRTIRADVLAFLEGASFDFIIGSVHNLNHTYVGFATVDDFGGPRAMYDLYYDEMLSLVESGFPSVVGHLDLPRRYHDISPLEVDSDHFEARLREVFRTAARNGVGFEVNASGLIRGNGYSFPEPELIGWFVEDGGQVVTVGSDSHRTHQTSREIARIYDQLSAHGITWRTSFVGGEQRRVPLVGDR